MSDTARQEMERESIYSTPDAVLRGVMVKIEILMTEDLPNKIILEPKQGAK